ncbi:MAG: ABC-type amino acid transport substrate-binding protein [Psychrobacter glaciei]|jgi:ABC-type amino acid transport substrate-binding protein|uniref:Basic amino acid ABC transporter substrate-binding protein n=1 Tax=Psychrobacter glaciei TaxID=619771 RepID=A0ABQ3GQJ3_9GAMM|nr:MULTISPECIES: transporter substrate-binding domain-containing protein [Psychrobacter]GHD29878.1 basic amino acid ABC transporter substrate-binding protein [Psychrobacter glaciei]
MKQIYRMLPIVLSVGLFGCGNSSTQESANSTGKAIAAESKDEFVSKLPDTAPTLKVATTGTMPPFSFQDDYGNMQGIDIDSIRALGEEQGFKVEFYKETWQNMFDSVASGGRDLAISGISYKDDRAEKYGLSDPYFFNPSSIMYAKSDTKIKGIEDLAGMHVAAMEGSKQEDQLNAMGQYSEMTTRSTAFLLYEDLMQGKVDVILHDLPILQYTAKNHPEYDVTIVPYEGADNPSAQQVILMAKGNSKLINTVNEGIAKLEKKGTFKAIDEQWLGASEPATKSATTNEQSK